MLGAILILLAGSIAEITASSWKSWLGAAVLVRCGVGLAQSILITYVSELTPFQIRGFMIGAYQLFIALGQLISAVATQLVIETQPNKWKPLIATEFIFTGVLMVMIWWVPESHLYYARKGEHEKAKESMLKLYGNAPGYDVVCILSSTNDRLADKVAAGARVPRDPPWHRVRAVPQHGIQAVVLLGDLQGPQLAQDTGWLYWDLQPVGRGCAYRLWVLYGKLFQISCKTGEMYIADLFHSISSKQLASKTLSL